MQTYTFNVFPRTDTKTVLRLFGPDEKLIGTRELNRADVEAFIAQVESDYRPHTYEYARLDQLGKRLFAWIDGNERWLTTALAGAGTNGLALRIDVDEKLGHLPWELLFDGAFVCANAQQPFTPVRFLDGAKRESKQANRPLRVLFIACSPIDVKPVLSYEAEEKEILQTTRATGIELVVEETGSLSGLRERLEKFERDYFDVVHLTGHATVTKDGTPVFVMEDELGYAHQASAEDLAEAFQGRIPRLVFLSGCKTGEAPEAGQLPSLAEAIAKQGAVAVLGWALPVYDHTGIEAASALYRALSTDTPLDEAIAKTRRNLAAQANQFPDWHLLRAYANQTALGPLVTAPRAKSRASIPAIKPADKQFIDHGSKLEVCPPDRFVGRRRPLQNCLRALKTRIGDPDFVEGVVIHGLGGLGKSSLAARLCQRMDEHTHRVVMYGNFDEADFNKALNDEFGGEPGATDILNSTLELKQRLKKLLSAVLSGKPALFVFDDFENALDAPANGTDEGHWQIKPKAATPLLALLWAIRETASPSRVIITTRPLFDLPAPYRLHRESLNSLREAELDKKLEQLNNLGGRNKTLAEDARQRGIALAAGNPRLMEWMDKALGDAALDHDALFDAIEHKAEEFREEAWVNKLMSQLHEAERKLAARMAVYNLPMPLAAIQAVDADPRLDERLTRLVNVGLTEKEQVGSEQSRYFAAPTARPALEDALSEGETQAAVTAAAQHLFEQWKERPNIAFDEDFEAMRLGMMAKNCQAVGDIGTALAKWLYARNRYRECRALCEFGLTACEEGGLRHFLARAQEILGELDLALKNYRHAQDLIPEITEAQRREKTAITHNMAGVFVTRGDLDKAMSLYQQSLQLKEQLGDLQGKSATLHAMANVFVTRGDLVSLQD